jgi:hypothetical protein
METGNDKDELIKLIQTNKEIVYKICNSYCHNKVDREDFTYSGVYPFTFSGDVRSLFVQKRLGRCKINTFS